MHTIAPFLLRRTVRVAVIGCGGTGSAILVGLPHLHHGLLASGHPSGLSVTAIDGDRISPANCVRQPFSESEIGLFKSVALINRLNLFWGLKWEAVPQHVSKGHAIANDIDLVVGCVDAPLSASSKNQYRTILSGIFSFNIKRGRYDVNPVKAVRQEKEPAGRDSLMMPDEFRQFRAKCQELGDYELDCFSVLATTTALRKGSLLPRKWADVHNLDGDLPFIMVPLTKNGEPKAALLSDEAVESLKKLPSYGASEYLFPAKPNPRFKGDFKRPYAWDLGKRFRRVCRLIGIRSGTIGEVGPRIHDWRHFSASVLLGQGVPDNVIAKHTGHKSKELERYKHLFPELRQQTVQLIDKEVKIPKKKT